jgi:RecB family endonuclease NucS
VVVPIDFGSLDIEARLEDILDKSIGIASPNGLVIGRQVHTDHGQIIDLLAIDQYANLVVLKLNRDKTYSEAVSKCLITVLRCGN